MEKYFKFKHSYYLALKRMNAEEAGEFIKAMSNFFFEGNAFPYLPSLNDGSNLDEDEISDIALSSFFVAKATLQEESDNWED